MDSVDQTPLEVIQRLLPSFDITNWIGPDREFKAAGGYGCVYKGTMARRLPCEESTEEVVDVAIKEIRKGWQQHTSHIKLFAKEIYIMAMLEHPNVIKLEGFIQEEGSLSLVSKWAENGSLVEYIKSNAECDRVNIARGIANGLKYIHSLNVIHSDLKAANVLINGHGQPMITDFGLSRKVTYSQAYFKSSGNTLGCSWRWLARELVPGNHQSGRTISVDEGHTKVTDMWAFGMTIYETITGKVPYHNINQIHLIFMEIASKFPQKPDKMRAEEMALWMLCERCWVAIPGLRITAEGAVAYFLGIDEQISKLEKARKRPVRRRPPKQKSGMRKERTTGPASKDEPIGKIWITETGSRPCRYKSRTKALRSSSSESQQTTDSQ